MKSFPKLFLFFLMINQYLYSADTQINNPHINNFQIKVITYNLMCDYCHYFDEDFLPFRERFNLQIDLISKQKPDLIALQEIRTKNQVDEILARLGPNYQAIYFSNSFFYYPDSVLIFNKKNLKLDQTDFYWLGPKLGKFTFGWATALPRILIQASFNLIAHQNKKLIVLSSHLDNLNKNREESLKLISERFKSNLEVPMIFLGDTNTRFQDPEMKWIIDPIKNAYQETSEDIRKKISLKHQEDNLCYRHKGKEFPACLVDHLFYNHKHFHVKDYDVISIRKNNKKLSDHLPITATFSFKFQ